MWVRIPPLAQIEGWDAWNGRQVRLKPGCPNPAWGFESLSQHIGGRHELDV